MSMMAARSWLRRRGGREVHALKTFEPAPK
jgi:hypothetical protein